MEQGIKAKAGDPGTSGNRGSLKAEPSNGSPFEGAVSSS